MNIHAMMDKKKSWKLSSVYPSIPAEDSEYYI